MPNRELISAKTKDLGGFSVRRLLPSRQQQMVGPWIFFDHMGPAQFPAGEGIDVRPHPHINLATVTYLFEGEILHRDSLGSEQAIRPGDINLMVAGRGITHSERERSEVRQQAHALHGLQLWHALPEADEEIDPAFYHYAADNLPAFLEKNSAIRLLIGEAYGFVSPVKTFAQTLYLEAKVPQGEELKLPECEELAVYLLEGAILIDEQIINPYQMLTLDNIGNESILAQQDSLIVLIGGEKMSPRFIEWNFISSRKQRIEQAKQDWQQRRFPLVPGDEDEFIPLP